jgi:hypothetical protein
MEDAETMGPPKKKRKKDPEEETYFVYYPDICIRLTADDATKLGLQDTTFLSVDRLEYVVWNADKSSYLYSICALVFEVPSKQLTLLRSPVSERLSEDSDDWQVVEDDDRIQNGNYLLLFEESASNSPFPFVSHFVLTTCRTKCQFMPREKVTW